MDLDLDQAALRAQLESLASLWQKDAGWARRIADAPQLSADARYQAGRADALDRCSQALKGLLDQWQ